MSTNKIKLFKYRNKTNLVIESDDLNYSDSINLIFCFFEKISQNKNIFIQYYGPVSDFTNSPDTIKVFCNNSNDLRIKAWVDSNWLQTVDKSLLEVPYCIICFCRKSFGWEDFCQCKDINCCSEPFLIASFGDCSFPTLSFSTSANDIVDEVVDAFVNTGYKIKKGL